MAGGRKLKNLRPPAFIVTHIRLCKIGIRKCLKTLCFFAEIVYNSIRERLAKLRDFLFSLIII